MTSRPLLCGMTMSSKNVRLQRHALFDRLIAVSRFTDDAHTRFRIDQSAQPLTHHGVIIGDEDADARWGGCGNGHMDFFLSIVARRPSLSTIDGKQ